MIQIYHLFGFHDLNSFSQRIFREGLSNNVDLYVLTRDRPRLFYTGDIKSTFYSLLTTSDRIEGHLPFYFTRKLGTSLWGVLLSDTIKSPDEFNSGIKDNLNKLKREISETGLKIVKKYIPDFLRDE